MGVNSTVSRPITGSLSYFRPRSEKGKTLKRKRELKPDREINDRKREKSRFVSVFRSFLIPIFHSHAGGFMSNENRHFTGAKSDIYIVCFI